MKIGIKTNMLVLVAVIILSTIVVSATVNVNVNTNSKDPGNQERNQEIQLIGQVSVNSIPENGSAASDTRNIPLHYVNPQGFARAKILAGSPGYTPPGQNTKVIINSINSNPLSITSNLVLNGVGGNAPNPCFCSPPDPIVGVGPNHVFEMVNLAGIIYYKNGNIAKKMFALSNFFGISTSSMSDPQIMYDSRSGKWFASIMDMSSNSVRFAVSKTNDPTGSWALYVAPYNQYFPDQPFIGASDDKFVISANDFVPSGNWPYAGVQYYIINKSDLVNWANPARGITYAPNASIYALHPAQHLTSTSVFYMVTNCLYSCVSDPASVTSSASLVSISGVPGGLPVTIDTKTFQIRTMSNPPGALQPGTSTTLNTNDNKILSAAWENNNLWFSANDACQPDTNTRSCIRAIQIDTSTAPISTIQDFDYASPGKYLFYPALSLSQGNLVLVYGQSSSTMYPSILVTGQVQGGSLQTPSLIKSGSADDLSGRYGDYFGAATDPSTISTFWVTGEYRKNSNFQNWNTAIARVSVS